MFDRMHISAIGYAVFMVINATQTWGGIFPFLPTDFQTDQVTLLFYLTQSLSFFAAFVASAVGAYRMPAATQHMLVNLVTALVFLGSAAIIAAMYLPAFTLALIVGGAALLGVGCAGMFMLWQRYFASLPAREGNARLVTGTALAAVLYYALYLVPTALTAFLIPIVMLPLCALMLNLSVREMSFDQPMFEDVPREHPLVYARVMQDSWRVALGIGAIAFASGLARGVAVLNQNVGAIVNVSSMMGSLVAALVILVLWRVSTFQFGLGSVFRVAYPVIIVGLLFFPFLQNVQGLSLFAGLTYMTFSLVVLVVMMQCAQISRDRGINPVFIYGFFGSVMYGMQSVGFLLGWLVYDIPNAGADPISFLSLLAMFVMGLALFVSSGAKLGQSDVDQIEFVKQPVRVVDAAGDSIERTPSPHVRDVAEVRFEESLDFEGAQLAEPETAAHNKPALSADLEITDRLSKQCLVLKEQFGLSRRETEVTEQIARGLSMAAIADALFISENTVRTHAKHIYTKLDIHSRQELGALLQDVSVA